MTPSQAWAALIAGNERFVAGTPRHPNQSVEHRSELASGQRPFATLFGCSDSRVAAEVIFDQGLGDLFVVRTAGRMDSYVDQFQAAGGSMVMLAKGNRSKAVTDACNTHGGFYLGSIGGPAARLAQDCIKSVEVIEYPELGMEAIWRIEVEDFPAFIVVDDKGDDFFAAVTKPVAFTIPKRPGL